MFHMCSPFDYCNPDRTLREMDDFFDNLDPQPSPETCRQVLFAVGSVSTDEFLDELTEKLGHSPSYHEMRAELVSARRYLRTVAWQMGSDSD